MAAIGPPSPVRTPTPPPPRLEFTREGRALLGAKVRVSDMAVLRAELQDVKEQVAPVTSTLSSVVLPKMIQIERRLEAVEETMEQLGMAFTRFQGQISVVSPEMARRAAFLVPPTAAKSD